MAETVYVFELVAAVASALVLGTLIALADLLLIGS
jgi:hypothetical protein